MIFISLGKWKQAPTKDMRPQMDKFMQEMEKLASSRHGKQSYS
jgi:hypothetical protein